MRHADELGDERPLGDRDPLEPAPHLARRDRDLAEPAGPVLLEEDLVADVVAERDADLGDRAPVGRRELGLAADLGRELGDLAVHLLLDEVAGHVQRRVLAGLRDHDALVDEPVERPAPQVVGDGAALGRLARERVDLGVEDDLVADDGGDPVEPGAGLDRLGAGGARQQGGEEEGEAAHGVSGGV